MTRHPDLLDCLYLAQNGVPFDVAFSLDRDTRTEWVVALGQLNTGRNYDWATKAWTDPN